MHADEHRIEELVLRLPGVGVTEARSLGVEIAARVARALLDRGAEAPRSIESIDLRLDAVPNESRARLVERVVAAILREVGA